MDRSQIKSIAVIGPHATDLHLGGYSYDPGRGVTILDGIKAEVGESVDVLYAEGCRITESPRDWLAWWQNEVVQLYLRDQISSVARPVKELKDFARITLAPGETQAVTFSLTPDKLSFLDTQMRRVVEPGVFRTNRGAG